MGIGEWLFNNIRTYMASFAAAQSAAFITYVMPLVVAGLTIYIIVMGIAIAQGKLQNPVTELVWRLFRLSVILGFLVGSGVYANLVIGGFEGLRDGLAAATSTGDGSSIFARVDQIGNVMVNAGNAAAEEASKSWGVQLELWAVSILYWLAKVIVSICALVPMLIAMVYFYISLAVGPLAIGCLLFPLTSRYFDAWLGTVLVALLTNLAVAVVMSATLNVFQSIAASMAAKQGVANPLSVALDVLLATAVLAYVAWKASDLAAQWVGGSSLGNPMGLMASSAASAGVGAAASGGARGAHRVASFIGQKIRPNKIEPN